MASPEYLDLIAAEAEANRGNPPRRRNPSRVLWTPERAALVDLGDMIRELTQVMAYKDSQKKPPALKPLPRPVDPVALAEEHAAFRRHLDRIELMTPRG